MYKRERFSEQIAEQLLICPKKAILESYKLNNLYELLEKEWPHWLDVQKDTINNRSKKLAFILSQKYKLEQTKCYKTLIEIIDSFDKVLYRGIIPYGPSECDCFINIPLLGIKGKYLRIISYKTETNVAGLIQAAAIWDTFGPVDYILQIDKEFKLKQIPFNKHKAIQAKDMLRLAAYIWRTKTFIPNISACNKCKHKCMR